MEPLVFVSVLAAAVMHASWNALVKVAGDRLFSLALVMGTSSAIAFPFAIALGWPDPSAWIWIWLSVLVHLAYYIGVINQYRYGDLSQVYPMSRGAAPLLVATIAYFFAGETLGKSGFVAVVIISLGILVLAFPSRKQGMVSFKGTLVALYTAATIAGYTFIDGMGSRTDPNVWRYIAWLFFLEGLPLLFIMLIMRSRAQIANAWATQGRNSILGGVLSTAAYALAIWAMSITPMAAVSALRETSVIFATLIGTYIIKESLGPRRIAASILVTIGVICLQVFGQN